MDRLRLLVLGPDCNPERVSIPYVTYSHAEALSRLHDVTLIARSSVLDSLTRAKAPFHAIEIVDTSLLDRIYSWCFRWILKSNYDSQARTALMYPFSIAFELLAWRKLRHRILEGEFDIVLRLVPMSPSLPSPFAFFLRNGPVPFVLGPLNGGLPWPDGFTQLDHQKEWVSKLRNAYRFLPFANSTYRHATAIIAASSQTYSEFASYRDKLFFVPEPGIATSLCAPDMRDPTSNTKLELIFVGGLVPRKACDLAIRAAAPLLKRGIARFTVVGDGPERGRLEQLAKSLGVEEAVAFLGWISHSEVLRRMRLADVMVFPTLRDNGAGVVFEALAAGAVPVVADFGGPGDIVHPQVGYKVPLTNESEMVCKMQQILTTLAEERKLLNRLRLQGMSYARECLTWEAKARSTSRVLNWAVGRGLKPNLVPPKFLGMGRVS